MFGKKQKVDLTKMNSIIEAGTYIVGRVKFTGTMKISGRVDGSIEGAPVHNDKPMDAVLIIEGRVSAGTIEADHIIVTGYVQAEKVIARKSLIVISGGKFFVDAAEYGSITVDETATIDAMLSRIKPEEVEAKDEALVAA